jgi:tetratricopeptide (TPR) repeat protein
MKWRIQQMKKIVIIFLLVISFGLSGLLAADKEQTDAWLALMGEKDLQVKLQKLEVYYNKYGSKENRNSMYMYLNLAETTYLLQQYEKAIPFGEKALTYKELDASYKLRMYLYLANAYNLTKKDLDKAYNYAEQVITIAKSLHTATEGNSAIDIGYTAPALRIQVQLLAAKSDDPQSAMTAFNKALEAFQLDKSDKSANIVKFLSERMLKNEKVEEAIRGVETINQAKPNADYYKMLGMWYARLENMPQAVADENLKASYQAKSIENLKASYQMKRNAKVAYDLGVLLNQAKDIDNAIEFLAESYLLNDEKYSPEALKLFEHLFFFEKAKDLPKKEQEKGYNEILAAAKVRLGITLP